MENCAYTAALINGEAILLKLECSYARGFAGTQLLGNVGDLCRDGKERAKTVLENHGFALPAKRIVINISPADIRKDGNHYDLPMAMCLLHLLAEKSLNFNPQKWLFAGEIGLDGDLRPIAGVVPFALAAVAAGFTGMVVAESNLPELDLLRNLSGEKFQSMLHFGFSNFAGLLQWCCPTLQIAPAIRQIAPAIARREMGVEIKCGESTRAEPKQRAIERGNNISQKGDFISQKNFNDMLLEPLLEQVALVAAVGMHHLLLRGVPGAGKSMFAERLVSILPNMGVKEHLEALKIHSSHSQVLNPQLLEGVPPMRAPHHQASAAAIIGTADQPGELSLAHGGILFLDEITEFRRDLLEALREPLQTGKLQISRANNKIERLAQVLLIAACNNCPCGWYGSEQRPCCCPIQKVQAYLQKLSGPLMDRIDLQVNMRESHTDTSQLFLCLFDQQLEGSDRTALMRKKVIEARKFAFLRNQEFGFVFNRDIPSHQLFVLSGLSSKEFHEIVSDVIPPLLSRRSLLKVLKISRTLADLDQEVAIRKSDVLLALSWQNEQAALERGDRYMGLG
jgi:magnesium chelatase family protein